MFFLEIFHEIGLHNFDKSVYLCVFIIVYDIKLHRMN